MGGSEIAGLRTHWTHLFPIASSELLPLMWTAGAMQSEPELEPEPMQLSPLAAAAAAVQAQSGFSTTDREHFRTTDSSSAKQSKAEPLREVR